MFSVQAPEAAIHWVTGKVKERIEYRISTQCLLMPRLQIRRPLRLDEFVAMRIFDVIGRPEMKLDARFPAQRNDAPAVMQQSGATVGRVYDICDIVEDRHFKERGIMVEVEDADKGSLPMHNIVPRVSVTPGCCRRPAPLLGEHTGEILSEIGFAWEHLGEKPRMTEGVE